MPRWCRDSHRLLQQVHYGEAFELDVPIQPLGNDEYRASTHICLVAGFYSNPEAGTSLLFRISHTGIQDNTSNISAYPNPAKDILNICLSGRPLAKQATVQVIDAKGRVCMEHLPASLGERLVLDVSPPPFPRISKFGIREHQHLPCGKKACAVGGKALTLPPETKRLPHVHPPALHRPKWLGT